MTRMDPEANEIRVKAAYNGFVDNLMNLTVTIFDLKSMIILFVVITRFSEIIVFVLFLIQ